MAKSKRTDHEGLLCYGARAYRVGSSTQINVPNEALGQVGITSKRVMVFGDPANRRLIVTREPSAAEQHDLATGGGGTTQ